MIDRGDERLAVADAGPRGRGLRRALVGGAVLLALATVGGLGWVAFRAMLLSNAPLARAVGQPVAVVVGRVERDEIAEVVGGTTLAGPFLSIDVNAVVSQGRVNAVMVEPGQVVAPDLVLLEFDEDVFREAVARARLQIESARADLERVQAEQATRGRDLREAVTASRERVASTETGVQSAQQAHDRTRVLWQRQVVALADLERAKVALDEARALRAAAALQLVRAESDLANEGTVARAQIEAARLRLGVAEQELAQARKNLENTTIRAPRGAVVRERRVAPGEWVKSGQTLFVLDQVEPIFAVAQFAQEHAPYVTVGQRAEVVFDAYPTRPFAGAIARLDPTVDPATRTFKAFVLLGNARIELRPGMAAFTRLMRTRTATLVPRLAVINPTGAPSVDATVFVVADSVATVRKVKLGRTETMGRVEVLGGVAPGEEVVVYGQRDLNSGDRVRIDRIERGQRKDGS